MHFKETKIKYTQIQTQCHRGKAFQARVLKRMVAVGFLDTETALSVLKQSLPLQVSSPVCADGLLHLEVNDFIFILLYFILFFVSDFDFPLVCFLLLTIYKSQTISVT